MINIELNIKKGGTIMKKRIWNFCRKIRSVFVAKYICCMAAVMSVMTQYGCFTSFAAGSIADGNGGLILESKVIVGSEIQGEIAVIPKVIKWAECDNSFTLSYNANDADFKYVKSSKYDSDYIDLSNTTLPYDDGNIVVSNVGSGKIIFSISPKLKLNQKRLSCPLGEFVFEMKKTSTEFSFSNKTAADVESSVSASAAVTGNRVNISGTAPNNTDNQLSMMLVDKNNCNATRKTQKRRAN